MMLLDTVVEDYRGLDAVVIGKSNIVGKPVAMLLLERECTVTVTHIATQGLPDRAQGRYRGGRSRRPRTRAATG
jgi:methylenetetrahydrofolate dehydrogenase (NADP+)/methenyltetrahydrofolate cyclohydrolase